ncbi:MAG: hypothetical protein ACN4GT_13465 [Gammaproteobacteria bacterium]
MNKTSMLPHWALATLLLAAVDAAQAADKLTLRPGMVGVADIGAISCATFSHMYPAGPTGVRQAVLTYSQGYFFARSGKTTDEILSGLPADNPWDFETLTDHIVDYCAANPESAVHDAVIDLWGRLDAGPAREAPLDASE